MTNGIRERTAGLEIDSDGFCVGRGEQPFTIFEPGFGKVVVVVDNLPLVGNQFEKLANDLREIYSKPGTIEENGIWMPIDRLTKRTLGFCFIVYNTPQEAETAKETTQNYMLYTSQKLSVSLFDDIEKCLMIPDERRFPETKKYLPGENLQKWLVGDEARGQFLIRCDADIKVLWNDARNLKPISVYKRTFWTNSDVKWSPFGTYLATIHSKGAAVWGGGYTFDRRMRFAHPKVGRIDFSPGERFLVTCSNCWDIHSFAVNIFDVSTGKVMKHFNSSSAHEFAAGVYSGISWPVFRWAGGRDEYFASIGKNAIYVYRTDTFTLIDEKSIEVENVADYCWSPADPIIALFVPELDGGNQPARVSLIKIPEKEELRQKNLFNVSDCKMYWQSNGDYLAVQVDRYTETEKITHTSFELFRMKERDIPIEVLELENNDKIGAFAWEPNGHRFAVIHGDSPRPDISLYTMHSAEHPGTVSKLATLKCKKVKALCWSPAGRFILFAGLRGFNGHVEFYDVDELKTMATAGHSKAYDAEWDPIGRYVATSVTSSHAKERGYNIWSSDGKLLYRVTDDDFFEVLPLQNLHNDLLLTEIVRRWSTYKELVRCILTVFDPLDVESKGLVDDFRKSLLNCFSEAYEDRREHAEDAVLALIKQEREDQQIDRALLKDAANALIEIADSVEGCFEDKFLRDTDVFYDEISSRWLREYADSVEGCFEDKFLRDTDVFYDEISSRWLREYTFIDHMLKVDACLRNERDRVLHYLHPDTESKVVELLEFQLLLKHGLDMFNHLEAECEDWLKHDTEEYLALMNRIFTPPSYILHRIANVFKEHVTAEGIALIQRAEEKALSDGVGKYKVFVRDVIRLHKKYDGYVTRCFANRPVFIKALDNAFKRVFKIHVFDRSIPELLAIFCEKILKKGGNEVIGEVINEVLKLIAHADDDRFNEFFRKKFARRLLLDRHGNLADGSNERMILSEVKEKIGGKLALDMDKMSNDLLLARQYEVQFMNYLHNNPAEDRGTGISLTILKPEFWPAYESSHLKLPAELVNCEEDIKPYCQAQTHRLTKRLTCIHSLGVCHVSGQFENREINLIVGTYQAAVLSLFNDFDELNYSEIRKLLRLDDDYLVKVLHSLACDKYEILKKRPSSGMISRDDSFVFNHEFTDESSSIEVKITPTHHCLTFVILSVIFMVKFTLVNFCKLNHENDRQNNKSQTMVGRRNFNLYATTLVGELVVEHKGVISRNHSRAWSLFKNFVLVECQ